MFYCTWLLLLVGVSSPSQSATITCSRFRIVFRLDSPRLEIVKMACPSPIVNASVTTGHACGHPACKFFSTPRGCKDGASCFYCHTCKWRRSSKRSRKRSTDVTSEQGVLPQTTAGPLHNFEVEARLHRPAEDAASRAEYAGRLPMVAPRMYLVAEGAIPLLLAILLRP